MFRRISLRWPFIHIKKVKGGTRHAPYFALTEALGEDGCPLCRLERNRVARYLENLAYENVNDPGVRDQLRAARGFCNVHAWQFREETRDGLATAIIYRDILDHLLEELDTLVDRLVASIGRWRPFRSLPNPAALREAACNLMPQIPCPACSSQDTMRQVYLSTLLEHLGEHDFQTMYEHSDGLCRPHLVRALHSSSEPAAAITLITGMMNFIEVWRDQRGRARQVHRQNKHKVHRNPAERMVAAFFGDRGVANLWLPTVDDSQAAARGDHLDPSAYRFDESGMCPVCLAVERVVDDQLRYLVESSFTWSDETSGVLASLCPQHAWRAVELLDSGNLLRLGETLLDCLKARSTEARSALLSTDSFDSNRSALLAAQAITVSTACPICQVRQRTEAACAQWLLYHVDSLLREERNNIYPLCLPHLAVTLHNAGDINGVQVLLRAQRISWVGLRDELSEYIRKHDYRFRSEPWGVERTAPWRAIELIAGARGIRP